MPPQPPLQKPLLRRLKAKIAKKPDSESCANETKDVKVREPSLSWTNEMVKKALDLRYDTTKITASKRFLSRRIIDFLLRNAI